MKANQMCRHSTLQASELEGSQQRVPYQGFTLQSSLVKLLSNAPSNTVGTGRVIGHQRPRISEEVFLHALRDVLELVDAVEE